MGIAAEHGLGDEGAVRGNEHQLSFHAVADHVAADVFGAAEGAGAKVVIAGSSEEKGQTAVELFKEAGFNVSFCRADLRSEADVEHLVDLRTRPRCPYGGP